MTVESVTPPSCAHEHTILTRRPVGKQGTNQVRRQCLRCGSSVGDAIKHADVGKPVEELPLFNVELQESWAKKVDVFYARRRAQQEAKRQAIIEERACLAEKHQRWYREYLRTEKWRAKRAAVLSRARLVCEGCGTAKATEVHHLTYAHVGDELLFELVALCRPCHERAHQHLEDDDLLPHEQAA